MVVYVCHAFVSVARHLVEKKMVTLFILTETRFFAFEGDKIAVILHIIFICNVFIVISHVKFI